MTHNEDTTWCTKISFSTEIFAETQQEALSMMASLDSQPV